MPVHVFVHVNMYMDASMTITALTDFVFILACERLYRIHTGTKDSVHAYYLLLYLSLEIIPRCCHAVIHGFMDVQY